MGIVYEALQTQPVRRHVALKIVRLGLDSRQVMARFEAERQALAAMDHPFIAKVLDAGEDDVGRPYFAMELVHGTPLTDFCDANRLTLRQRLSLFVLICQAVQHAHHKGVLHRDLKPSNILVSTEGKTTLPHIIDFGIAKAIGPADSDVTALTLHGQTVGTPAYMSPEQAGMDGLDVDTRSDIFSLGVILYQILAGVLPGDPADGGFHRFLAQLADPNVNFPYASSRYEKLPEEEQRRIAGLRSTTPKALLRELKGDLDWIVFAATEKDRAHRYPAATALADDIERYLSSRPLRARPPSGLYLLGKFLRRNTGGVAAAAVALAAILAGSAGVTMALLKAQAAEKSALREAETARRVTAFLTGLFETADPNEARGSTITVKELLDRGAARLARELRGDPVIEARLSQTLARVHSSLGLYPRSLELAKRAVELAERHN
ncbi:MAG: serine/threonine protein kinase, partial [Bryobacteraceae bacterium]|nr:serine/threonine protein kinase [Bryobacteraceae bacterium]